MKMYVIAGLLFIFSAPSFAGICGVGKITRIMEGGWNTDDYYIMLDYSSHPGDHPGTAR